MSFLHNNELKSIAVAIILAKTPEQRNRLLSLVDTDEKAMSWLANDSGGALVKPAKSPFHEKRLSFRLKSIQPTNPQAKESYFATCERGDDGKCLPKGQVGSNAPEEQSTNQQEMQQDNKKQDFSHDYQSGTDTYQTQDNLVQSGKIDELKTHNEQLVTTFDDYYKQGVENLKQAGASDEQLQRYQAAVDNRRKMIQTSLSAFSNSINEYVDLDKKYNETEEAFEEIEEPEEPTEPEEIEEPIEPEEPKVIDEPDAPDEPDEPFYEDPSDPPEKPDRANFEDQESFDEAFSDYETELSTWKKETAELKETNANLKKEYDLQMKEYKTKLKEHEKEVKRIEKENDTNEKNHEKAVQKWEKEKEKVEKQNDKNRENYERAVEKHEKEKEKIAKQNEKKKEELNKLEQKKDAAYDRYSIAQDNFVSSLEDNTEIVAAYDEIREQLENGQGETEEEK